MDSCPSVIKNLLRGWNFLANYDHASLGRIWIFFDSNVRMEVLAQITQSIHVQTFSLVHKKYFLLSVIYGANTSGERKNLWKDLMLTKEIMGFVPWVVYGDFNTELNMWERSNFYNGMPCSQNALDFR